MSTVEWLEKRRAACEQVRIDALKLVGEFAENAYEEARRRGRLERSGAALEWDRPSGHWDKVRREVKQIVCHNPTDTATRMLQRDED